MGVSRKVFLFSAVACPQLFHHYRTTSSSTVAIFAEADEGCYPTNVHVDPTSEYIPFFNVTNTSASLTFAETVAFDLVRASEWFAMNEIGKEADDGREGLSFARVVAPTRGSMRTPHYDANRAELVYVIGGRARATVVGLKNHAAGSEGIWRRRTKARRLNGYRSMSYEYESEDKYDERWPQTFLMEPGDAYLAPPGYMHYYDSVDDSESLVALSIYDAGTLSSHDLPQIMKGFNAALLSEVLQEPLTDVEGWYSGPRRVYIQAEGELDLSDAVDAENSKFPYISTKRDRRLTIAPRSDINGDVGTSSLDVKSFPALSLAKFSFAITDIAPGARLEPYWVDNADELVYVIEGSDLHVGRSGKAGVECDDSFMIQEGFLALHEETVSWYIENMGLGTAKLFRIFNSNNPTYTTLYDAYTALPEDVRNTMLK